MMDIRVPPMVRLMSHLPVELGSNRALARTNGRLNQAVSAARTWLKVDKPAVTSWITSSDLPQARKNPFLGLPPPAPNPPAGQTQPSAPKG